MRLWKSFPQVKHSKGWIFKCSLNWNRLGKSALHVGHVSSGFFLSVSTLTKSKDGVLAGVSSSLQLTNSVFKGLTSIRIGSSKLLGAFNKLEFDVANGVMDSILIEASLSALFFMGMKHDFFMNFLAEELVGCSLLLCTLRSFGQLKALPHVAHL